MMRDITAQEVYQMMKRRYPNADIFVLDGEYELPTKKMLKTAYDKFQKSLWKWNVFKWLRNKWDCDKFAWAFKASVSVGNALSWNNNAQPVGFICYFEEGDKTRSHAINNAVWSDGYYSRVQEIEPQPKHGFVELTEEERDSAWLVII